MNFELSRIKFLNIKMKEIIISGNVKKKWNWKVILAVVFILFAGFFFWQQRNELVTINRSLQQVNGFWFFVGFFFTVAYVIFQAALYVYSFRSVDGIISWKDALRLFLKRNVVAVFLPGGGLTALAYVPNEFKVKLSDQQKLHQASVIYGFIGIFSVFIVAIPVLLYLLIHHTHVPGILPAFITMLAMLLAIGLFVWSVQNKGLFYKWVIKARPKWQIFLTDIFSFKIIWKQFLFATFASILIEVVGVVHLYVSMLAVGVTPSWEASLIGYIVAAVFLIISPFLRGLGAIEVSLTFILVQYGFTTADAFLISLLFRIFELWLPLFVGLLYYVKRVIVYFKNLVKPKFKEN